MPRILVFTALVRLHIFLRRSLFSKGRSVFAFTRPGDTATQKFALSLGAKWAGGSGETPPEQLDAAIIFATVGDLVPTALRAVRKGGRVVCAGIHMSDIPSFPYSLLWEERELLSVANLTRQDGIRFSWHGAINADSHSHHEIPASKGKSGARRFAGGQVRGGGRSDSMTLMGHESADYLQ